MRRAALVTVLGFVGAASAALPLRLDETLVEFRPDLSGSWTVWTNQCWKTGADSVRVVCTGPGRASVGLRNCMRSWRTYFPDYATSGRCRVAFEYRTSPKTACAFSYSPNTMLKHAEAKHVSLKLVASEAWRSFEATFDVTTFEGYCANASLGIEKAKDGDWLEVRKFRLVELPPEKDAGREFLLGGAPATEIALVRTADERTLRNERRAAMMLRYAFCQNGYRYLPIREYDEHPAVRRGVIYVGRAAEGKSPLGNDFFTDAELETIRTRDGTGAYAVKGGAAGITGNNPGGPQLGAFRFLARAGIERLATDAWTCRGLDGIGEVREVKVPAIPYRTVMDRFGQMPELRGLQPQADVIADLSVGAGDLCPWQLAHDSLGFIVPMTEFGETHPEFFALQKDGTRMDAKRFKLGHTQYCWSNSELRKVVAERYLEIMRCCPAAKLFCFAPGDGAGRQCRCAECAKRPDTSTAFVELMNDLAAVTGKAYPDRYVYSYSYATTLEAPKVDRVDPHVKFTDSIYMASAWPASQWFDHPANEPGRRLLAAWRRVIPDIGLMPYFQNCPETANVWPLYDGAVKLGRDFAEHGAYYSDNYFWNPSHAEGWIPNTTVCGDLLAYVFPRIEIDPAFDDRAAADRFFADFYRGAAKETRAYFDQMNDELKRRDWVQNTEQIRRGFVTPALADEALALLDRALAAAKGDPSAEFRVKREKQLFLLSYVRDVCRGRGNVPSADYPVWARRVADLVRLTREVGGGYAGYGDGYGIFEKSVLLKLDGRCSRGWAWHKQLDAVLEDPEKALGGAFPLVQEKTGTGWKLPAGGWVGGEYQKATFWRGANGRAAQHVKRESSGIGLLLAVLKLDRAPTRDVTLRALGIDSEKPTVAKFQIEVNGRVVASGDVPWGKDKWSEARWTVPAGAFRAGVNDIAVRNVTPDPKAADCGIAFQRPSNYYWGWFLVSDLFFDL